MPPPSLVQNILSRHPELGHDPSHVLKFYEFIDLLRKEENYFKGEEGNTKLMITRLRKIFYDKWGWDTQLIRKAARVKGRYRVKIIDCPHDIGNERSLLGKVRYYEDNEYKPKCRLVTYRRNDRVYGSRRVGQVPFIYKYDHQDVRLPDGYHCDLGHVLAGLDALNHPQKVGLFQRCFLLKPWFPTVDSNADVTTWLGDIGTICADFLFFYLREKRMLKDNEKQFYIDSNASASDMLGNIDAFVINHIYKPAGSGRRMTDILDDFYGDSATGKSFREKRFHVFCECVGLKEWNGQSFQNEKKWLQYYSEQLRTTTAFMVFSSAGGLDRMQLPHRVVKRQYESIIEVDMLLHLFLQALKKLLRP